MPSLLTLLLALGLLPAGEARAEEQPQDPFLQARALKELGQHQDARAELLRVVERLQPAEPALSWAQLLAYSAVLLSELGFNEEALRQAQDSLRLAKKLLPEDSPELTYPLDGVASYHYLLGHWEESERHFLESQRLKQLHLPPDHPELGIALLNLGRIRKIQRDWPAALQASREARELLEPHADYRTKAVQCLRLEGGVLAELGDWEEARATLERARLRARALQEGGSPEEARILIEQGRTLTRLGLAEEARQALEQARSLRRSLYGDEHPLVSESELRLGDLYQKTGRFELADQSYRAAIAAFESSQGAWAQLHLESLNGLALSLVNQARYEEAERLFSDALARYETEGQPQPELRNNLALLYLKQGSYAEAESLLSESVSLLESQHGRENPNTITALANLAILHRKRGDTARSQELHQELLRLTRLTWGDAHPEFARQLNNLASDYIRHGQSEVARKMLERALEIKIEFYGEEHLEVCTAQGNLAWILQEWGQLEEARVLLKRSLDLRRRILGEGHPDLRLSLLQYAAVLTDLRRFEEAAPLLEEALALSRSHFGEDSEFTARTLEYWGLYHYRMGRPEAAVEVLQRALLQLERLLGESHPDLVTLLSLLAKSQRALDQPEAARAHLERALQILAKRLRELDRFSEQEAIELVTYQRSVLDDYLQLGEAVPLEDQIAAVLAWKGRVLKQQMGRGAAERTEGADPRSEEAIELAVTREQLAQLMVAGDWESSEGELTQLSRRKRRLERAVASQQQGGTREVQGEELLALSCASLEAGESLVEFLRYEEEGEGRYLAYVLAGEDCELSRIELGEELAHLDALASWRETLLSPGVLEPRQRQRGERLYQAFWEPLLPALGSSSRVFLSPDGLTSELAFPALPHPEGGYLVEHYLLEILEQGFWEAAALPKRERPEGWLLVGDVDFGEPLTETAAHHSCPQRHFESLPGTREELSQLQALRRPRRTGLRETRALSQRDATVGALLEALPGQRWVHIATHGFFDPGTCDQEGQRRSRRAILQANPMLMSGLALAGANQPPESPGEADGILTAEELLGLDLRGVELVVLSACDTGRGLDQPGEGIMGLRRALALAGVQSLVMSYWSVPDEATVELMVDFYRVLLRSPQAEPAVALREAQQRALARQRAEGRVQPMEWGGFMATQLSR